LVEAQRGLGEAEPQRSGAGEGGRAGYWKDDRRARAFVNTSSLVGEIGGE